jgi:hypothetical protein
MRAHSKSNRIFGSISLEAILGRDVDRLGRRRNLGVAIAPSVIGLEPATHHLHCRTSRGRLDRGQ